MNLQSFKSTAKRNSKLVYLVLAGLDYSYYLHNRAQFVKAPLTLTLNLAKVQTTIFSLKIFLGFYKKLFDSDSKKINPG